MNVLVKILIVFDLLCFAIYFGGDILSTALAKLRKKPAQKELFEFYEEDADTPLSVDSIRQLYSGEVDTFVEEKLLPDGESTAEVLTERELDVLHELAQGLSNKQIASVLNISEQTVKVHIRNLLRKLNVRSRVAATILFLQQRGAQ